MMDSTQNPDPAAAEIGYVVSGSLKDNLQVRLTVDPQSVQEGAFIVIRNERMVYYGLADNLSLGATDPRFADEPFEARLPAETARLVRQQTLYTNLEVIPALMLDRGPEPGSAEYAAWRNAQGEENPRPKPIKTIPSHHTKAYLAGAGDVAEIFGREGTEGYFRIGSTREQGHPVCIDLDKFVQRSAGIFGATGSGKSFLTRLLLAGLIHRDKASALVFDMHNEYGPDDTSSDTGQQVPGLRRKFPAKVRMVGLGRGTLIRGQQPDFNLEIAERDIQPEDIEMLERELNLKETTATTLEALTSEFKENWFHRFKEMKVMDHADAKDEDRREDFILVENSVAAWADRAGVNTKAAEALRSKLSRVFNLDYLVETPAANTLDEIIKALEAGQSVVLSFGKNERDLDYLLVTNVLTRKIREAWEKKTNQFRSEGGQEPRPLVIAVEEAHKLLNREMAGQTTFSQIAREMRKYYVTLLIIDQRPSQIYDEVLSQLGTRISGWLGDEDDIHAVLSGLAGRDNLRVMLSHLQPKEEVLLLGWGVPMPILARSRRYDDQFWLDLLGKGEQPHSLDENIKALYG